MIETDLPPSVVDMIERTPLEDFVLRILRNQHPDLEIGSLYRKGQTVPYVNVRRAPSFGHAREDMRFIDTGLLQVSCLCDGENADQDAAYLSEAMRVSLRNAWMLQTVVPDMGWISYFRTSASPRRVADWATAQGPVQYADLPTGVVRYEAIYEIDLRTPPGKLKLPAHSVI